MKLVNNPTPMEQRALDYCAATHEKRIKYANFVELLRRGSAEVLWAEEDGLLIYDRLSGAHSISATTDEAVEDMLPYLEDCDLFMGRELFYRQRIIDYVGLTDGQICAQMVYDTEIRGTAPLPVPDTDGEIRLLERQHIPLVHAAYHNGTERLEYLESCIDVGMLGLFVPSGTLAGFIGFHGEGSMGLLEVLPEYRRRGYGLALEVSMLNRALEIGQLYPYGHVVRGNVASMALQQSLPYVIDSEEELFWLF